MSEPSDDFEDLFENAPCGYIVMGADGRVCRANRTLCQWLGRSSADLERKRPHELLNIAGRIYYETHIAPLLRMQGFFHEVALDLVSGSGETVPVIANAVEHRDAEGRARYTRIAFLKAADRRRYERELLKARDAAQDALRKERHFTELREQLIAVLGHDLRNPLASLGAGIHLLLKAPKGESETSILTMMQAAGFRMAALINNLLDFARARLGGAFPLERRSEDLVPVLHQVVDELRTAMPDRVIEERYDIGGPVSFDRTRIGQLVSNLLANALTHGAQDQPVRIEATAEGTLVLSVTNSGDPISPSVRTMLFEPFFRGDVRPSGQGLGLGLYIASEIAKAHGGTLDVTSSGGETRFTFRMPLPVSGEPAQPGSAPPS
jgi:phosphoserine phosphatase RsbU/P